MKIYELREMYENPFLKKTKEEILAAYDTIDIEETDKTNGDMSLLHIAAFFADSAAVEHVLSKNIDANIEDRYGKRSLHYLAAHYDRREISEDEIKKCAALLLDARASTIRKDDEGKTAVATAAEHGAFEVLEVMVEKGAKLTVTDNEGNSPLHIVCQNVPYDEENQQRYCKTAEILVYAGFDPEEKNNYGKSALDFAIESGKKELTAILRGMSGEDDAEVKTGGMNLWQAVEKKDYEAVKANIALGCDVNAVSEEQNSFTGKTALGIACHILDFESVKLLVESGADVNLKNSEGKTALGECLGYLGDRYFDSGKADKKIPEQIIRYLVEKGLQINGSVDDEGNTALLKACAYIDRSTSYNGKNLSGIIAKEMLKLHCDVNCKNLAGQTALMLLCMSSNDTIAVEVLEEGADITAADKNGNTPLMYAAKNSRNNKGKEIGELLFDFGDPKAAALNNEGKSALDIAAEADNEPFVKWILTKI